MAAVERWAAEDRRVRIIRNEHNLGEGGSRNRGINEAQGDYFCSLDPDDWIAPNYFELLYGKAQESGADIVKGTRIRIDETTDKEMLPRSALNRQIRHALRQGKPLFVPFTYEHQTAFIKRTLFDDGTHYGASPNAGDTTFLLRICTRAGSISFADSAHYYYLQHADSATGSYNARRSFAELASLAEQIDFLSAVEDQEHARSYLMRHVCAYSSRFYRALKQEIIDKEVEKAYYAQLISQVRRIPEHEKLYGDYPELKVLLEDGAYLPMHISSSGNAYRGDIGTWVAYLTRPLALSNQALVDRYAYLLASFFKRKLWGGRSFFQSLQFVRSEHLKLDRRTRQTLRKSMLRMSVTYLAEQGA